MNKEEIDKQKLNAIKKYLVKGDMADIARKMRLSSSTVYKCLNGTLINLKIISLAIQKTKINQTLFSKIKKKEL